MQFMVNKRTLEGRPVSKRFEERYTVSATKHLPSQLVWGAFSRCGTVGSSVARGVGGYSPIPIGMSTKMQNGKNTTFLALLRLFYALEWINSDLKHLLKHISGGGGGANLSKTKVTNK